MPGDNRSREHGLSQTGFSAETGLQEQFPKLFYASMIAEKLSFSNRQQRRESAVCRK
jgi:hypothetical protein